MCTPDAVLGSTTAGAALASTTAEANLASASAGAALASTTAEADFASTTAGAAPGLPSASTIVRACLVADITRENGVFIANIAYLYANIAYLSRI